MFRRTYSLCLFCRWLLIRYALRCDAHVLVLCTKTYVQLLCRSVTANDVSKKPKIEIKDEIDAGYEKKLEKTLAQQNKQFFHFRDQCERILKKKDMLAILEHNNQTVPEGTHGILDALADLLTFGALERCKECGGQLVFCKSNYVCTGDKSEWLKCANVVREPPRTVCRIPKHLAEAHKLLAGKLKVQVRAVRFVMPTSIAPTSSSISVKKEEELAGPKVARERPPLYNMEFVAIARLEGSQRAELKKSIQQLGGKLVSKMHAQLAAVLATEKDVEKMSDRMIEAKQMNIQVLRLSFVEEIGKEPTLDYIRTKSICDWGSDVSLVLVSNDCHDTLVVIYTFVFFCTAADPNPEGTRCQVSKVKESLHEIRAQIGHTDVER